jgi:magnesium transporter
MNSIIYRGPDGVVRRDLSIKDVPALVSEPGGFLWVDLCEPEEKDWKSLLVDTFHYHHLAVEDAINDVNYPKIDDYHDYLYLVVHGVARDDRNRVIGTDELDIFLGRNYLLTFHTKALSTIDDCISNCLRDERRLNTTPDMFLAGLLEYQMDRYMQVIDDMDKELDDAEDLVLKKPGPDILERVIELRRSISNMRRILGPQREVIVRLARGDFSLISEKSRPYFRDVYDQSVRIMELIESSRDLASGLLEIHLTATSNKLNEIMRILMVVSVIIMPMTLLTGIYGMNVKWLPMADRESGLFGVISIMVMIAVCLIIYFRKKKWL